MGYSTPIHKELSLKELQKHLYSRPWQPDVIPYITSYYKENWGFCLCDNQRKNLKSGTYQIHIDTTLENGHLQYADVIIPATLDTKEEILISTYICHPSMANNELSGICVSMAMIKYIQSQKVRKYNYRFVFAPETIGSLIYIHEHLEHLQQTSKAVIILSCVGDERTYSAILSRHGNLLTDHIATHIMKNISPDNYTAYPWETRGSDERQYGSPKVNLPAITLCCSKFGTYPEYHSSADNLTDVVTPQGLENGLNYVKSFINVLENNCHIYATTYGEPQLGKRGLYPNTSGVGQQAIIRQRMNVLSYADGQLSLLEIAEKINLSFNDVLAHVNLLEEHNLLTKTNI